MRRIHFISFRSSTMAENDITAGQASAAQPKADAPAGKKPPNKRVLIVVGVIALLAIGAGGRMWYRSSHFVETENAYVTGRMHQVSSRVAGVVTKVLVEDNQMVKAGDVLALLDPADQAVRVEQIQAQIASMEQQVKQSDAQLLQVRAQAARTPSVSASCTTTR
jgi:membrane fusion protein (multidrug efflux system)